MAGASAAVVAAGVATRVGVGPAGPVAADAFLGDSAVELLDADDGRPPNLDRPWALPPVGLLAHREEGMANADTNHAKNIARIEKKLRDFGIPATVTGTNNTPFSAFSLVFAHPLLCKALLDRITDRAHIIETGTESYRFRRTVEGRQKKRAS
jgi:hypothetical protein